MIAICFIWLQALLQQAFRQDAKRRQDEQHEARLVRVSALDEAALHRSMQSAKQNRLLRTQLQQRMQMSAC